jgi:SAM-dependent methyltransferase
MADGAADEKASADHFSKLAAGYAAFRLRYPDSLFDALASIAPSRARAWDVGAGSGQATLALADRFEHVIGTDLSARQLQHAPAHARIEWHVTPAESVPMILSDSVDLVTVAQALHWFDHDRFYAEVRRVAVTRGVIAAWTYGAVRLDGDPGTIVHRYIYEDVGAYWPPERRFVDNEYRDLAFPFERIPLPAMSITCDWTLDELLGYLRTMSATGRFVDRHGTDPVARIEPELSAAWGAAPRRRATWPLPVLAGHI